MKSLRSIRVRLALATAGVLLLLGSAFGVASYQWLRTSLDEESLSFALHEAQEVANVVAALRTREEIEAGREILDGLFPEEGVIGLAVFDLDGQLVRSLPREAGPWSEPWPEGFRAARRGETPHQRIDAPGLPTALRTAMLVDYGREPRWIVTAIVSEERAVAALESYRASYGVGLAATLVVGFFGCLLLLSIALQPLARMVDDAARMLARGPGARLDEPPEGSELRELATLLNQMLERDERAVESLRRFTAHAGHELRTPLARIRGEAELALRGDTERQRECIASVLDEAEELARMIDALLELARAEDGGVSDAKPLPLLPLVEELAEQARVVGEPRQVSVSCEGPQPPWVLRNRVLLVRAIWNLIDNAIKFGRPGGRIELRLRSDARWASLDVADDGPGLPEDCDALFEPFHRGDDRAPATPGHGLGLALSRAVLRRHGGEVSVARDAALGGALFSVRLPCSEEPAATA